MRLESRLLQGVSSLFKWERLHTTLTDMRWWMVSSFSIKHFHFFPLRMSGLSRSLGFAIAHTKRGRAANELRDVTYASLSLAAICWICLRITGDRGCVLNLAHTAGFLMRNSKITRIYALYLLNMYLQVHNVAILHLLIILDYNCSNFTLSQSLSSFYLNVKH